MSENPTPERHWADRVADEVLARGITHPVIATGISPSGVFHVGHLREILTGDAAARALRDRGAPARLVFVVDDFDPLRKVHRLLDEGVFGPQLGKPLFTIPAPVGAGNYAEQYPDFANRVGSTVSSYEEFGEKRYAHSLYLEIGAETGLAGIVVFSAILCAAGICGWRAFRSYRRLRDLKMARLVVSLMIVVLGYLATSLFLHASYPRHLWLLLALVAASAQIARKASSSDEIGGTE